MITIGATSVASASRAASEVGKGRIQLHPASVRHALSPVQQLRCSRRRLVPGAKAADELRQPTTTLTCESLWTLAKAASGPQADKSRWQTTTDIEIPRTYITPSQERR